MGTCYLNCAVTGLPIDKGEPAVMLFLTPQEEGLALVNRSPVSNWTVASLPFFVKGDDYNFSTVLPSMVEDADDAKEQRKFKSQLAYRLLAPRVWPMKDNPDEDPAWYGMTLGKVGLSDRIELSRALEKVQLKKAKTELAPDTRHDLYLQPLAYTVIRRDIWDMVQNFGEFRLASLRRDRLKKLTRCMVTAPVELQKLELDRRTSKGAWVEALRSLITWEFDREFTSDILKRDLCYPNSRPLLGRPAYCPTVPERKKAVKMVWQILALIHYLDLLAKPLMPMLAMASQDTWRHKITMTAQIGLMDAVKELLESKKAYWENEG